ncbi:MAG TPA: PEP-CTERM system TPR-repeat protein PrsT, partial [Gammaproteobacteria bacterium]|nr:PEP-CTERM system TPR-repeat protein PrsT [Gammaproteobacteria bacterium]
MDEKIMAPKWKIVLLIFILWGVTGCSEKPITEQAYVEKAKVALDQGDYRASIIHLKNALGNYPDSAEARFLLGDIYVRAGEGGGAEKELNRALALGVSAEAVLGKLADALLIQGKADAVIKRFALKDSDPLVVKGLKLVALGDAYFQKRDIEKAQDYYNEALPLATAEKRAQLGLARVNILKRKLDRARELVLQAQKGDEGNVLAWLTRADVYKALGDAGETLASFEKAALNANSHQDYYYFVAMKGQIKEYLQQNLPDKAGLVMSQLAKSFYKSKLPDIPEMNQLQAVLAFQKKQYDKSMASAEKVLKKVPNHYGAILILGAINTVKGNYEQADDYLRRFLLAVPRNVEARKMLAYVQLNRNEAKSAVETLKPFENVKKLDVATLALVASASLRAGDADKGAKYYEQALAEEPDSPELKAGLAQSYVGMKEYEKALVELGQIRDKSSNKSQTSLAIVETQIKAKNYSAALKELDKLAQSDVEEPLYVSLKGTVYLLKNEETKAKLAFEKALEVKPGFPPAARNLAMLAIKNRNTSDAEAYYKQILKENPTHVVTMYDYAQLKMRDGELSAAEHLIKQATEQDKNKARNAVQLARLYLRMQKPSKALAALREVASVGQENAAVYAEQGNAQMMLGEYRNALDSYQKLANLAADSATVHYLVYTAQIALRNQKAAKASLTSALALDGEFVPALIARVKILLSEKKLESARQIIQRLEKLAGNNTNVALLQGELAMYQGNSANAISIYEALYEKTAGAVVVQRLAQAYWAAGDKDRALETLDEASEKKPENARLQYVLA